MMTKRSLFRIVAVLLSAARLQSQNASANPPTVDPTYGLIQTSATASIPNSKWIWTAAVSDNQTIFLRDAFSLPQPPKSAVLYATADDLFEIFVNGQKVGDTLASQDPVGWSKIQTFDVTDRLGAGRNVIAVRAINRGGSAGVLVRLDVDGTELLTTDQNWRVSDKGDLPADWNGVAFDDSTWAMATIMNPYGEGPWGHIPGWPDEKERDRYLAHLVMPVKSAQVVADAGQVTGVETLVGGKDAQVKITPDASGGASAPVLLVDFGQELAGRLRIWGTKDAPVSIKTGESRAECDENEPGLDNSGPFELKLAGAAPLSTPYSAFRFAKLTFPGKTPVELTRLICDDKYYPVHYAGTFDCSDPLLTRIWYAGAYTAHLCMQEDIWDAPKRDRGLWIGDLQVTGETISTAFADKDLMEHSIELVRDQAQHGNPLTELPTTDVNLIPGYSAAWFCTLADFHRHVGDMKFLALQHQKIITLLEYQRTQFKDDLFVDPDKVWDFCDWAAGFVLDGPLARATTDLYIIQGVHEAVYLLRELGDTANADKYSAWADHLTVAARLHLADADSHTYSNRLQENVMALYSGTATAEERRAIYQKILRPDDSTWKAHLTGNIDESEVMTPYYGYFVLQALDKLGRQQDAIDLMRRYWGDMIRRGAVTFWEKFDPAWPEDIKASLDKMPYLSLSHGWSSGPTSYLTETVLGVRPTNAGYRTVEIRPELGDLTWAEGDVPTPHGLIHVRVDRQDERTTVVVKLPPDIQATIQLGDKSLRADKAGTCQLSTP